MPYFQRIGLLGSLAVPEVRDSFNKLEAFLLAQGAEVIYEEQAAKLVDWKVDKALPIEQFSGVVDLAIVVGGDGSMLSASRKMAESNIPLLGINRGRLGFLTDISPYYRHSNFLIDIVISYPRFSRCYWAGGRDFRCPSFPKFPKCWIHDIFRLANLGGIFPRSCFW